jgi:hypothetical protein
MWDGRTRPIIAPVGQACPQSVRYAERMASGPHQERGSGRVTCMVFDAAAGAPGPPALPAIDGEEPTSRSAPLEGQTATPAGYTISRDSTYDKFTDSKPQVYHRLSQVATSEKYLKICLVHERCGRAAPLPALDRVDASHGAVGSHEPHRAWYSRQ